MGVQSDGTSASEASTGPGCRHVCDSASNKSVSLHGVQEAFGISIVSVFKDEADIGTPAKSSAAWRHLKAARLRWRREPSSPRMQHRSAESRWKLGAKVQFGGELRKNGQHEFA